MEFLGIGPAELLLILLIMLIVLGPQDMIKMGKQGGELLRKIIRSPIWKQMMSTSQEIRELPTKLAQETGLDEDLKELRKSTQVAMNPLEKELKSTIPGTNIAVPKIDLTPDKAKDTQASSGSSNNGGKPQNTEAPAAENLESPQPDEASAKQPVAEAASVLPEQTAETVSAAEPAAPAESSSDAETPLPDDSL